MLALILTCAAVTLTPAERDSILAETQGNEDFWLEILSSNSGEVLEEIEFLLATIPRLDRLEMTEQALMDHVLGALDSRYLFYDSLPDSLFRQCLVQYRIDEEPVTPYRTVLHGFWSDRIEDREGDVYTTASEIVSEIDEHMERFERDYLGGIGDPVSTLLTNGGTQRELRVLLCASLKSMGIASRSVRGWFSGRDGGSRRWLEIWDGDEWIPLSSEYDSIPDNWEGLALALIPSEEIFVTDCYTGTATLISQPLSDIEEGDWAAALSIPVEGKLLPLDWISLDPFSPDTLEVGEGPYFLMVSFRKPSGAVDMWLHRFDAGSGDTLNLDFSQALYSIVPLP